MRPMASLDSINNKFDALCRIITVGDELLNGIRVDTNTAWLAGRLSDLGICVERAVTVGDEEGAIRDAVAEGLEMGDVVIVCGGLGPTQDDRTKQTLADLFGVDMRRQPEVEEAVRRFFTERGRHTTQVNLDQALVPEGFQWHVNPCGTAPGLLRRHGDVMLFALPGVPGEMEALYDVWVGPLLAEQFGGRVICERRWYRTTGIGESDLFDCLGGLEDMAPEVSLAYLPAPEGVALYLTGRGADVSHVAGRLDEAEALIRKAAGSCLYASENLDLTEHIARFLTAKGRTLAVAESCTGGLIAHSLTNVPGASQWFAGGWVTYSNEAKEKELGVPRALLVAHGAVSEEVARAMADGARQKADTDYAVAVTGIAGPTGGTKEKPVGLTYVACAGREEVVVRRYLLGKGGRTRNKNRSTAVALDLLRRVQEGLDPHEGGWGEHG